MRFEPVHLPEDRRPNGKVSMTALRHYAQCPRSGYLYFAHKGGSQTREMVRGSAFHAVAERATRLMIEHGEVSVPPEVVKDILDEVLAEMPVVFEDHDWLREISYRWAAETVIDPSAVVACETLFVLDVGGYQVRAKVDHAELVEGGAGLLVRDYKTSRSAPTYDDVSRKRADGTFAAKSLQLVVYALLLAFGVPVRVEECPAGCGGEAVAFKLGPGHGPENPEFIYCDVCGGSGRIETPEPFSVASQAQRFDLEYVFPAIEDREGLMLRRSLTLTRLELVEYRASLEALLTRLTASEETGDWPAIVSDAACSECPAASMCPIPAELRDHRGTVNTEVEAAEAAMTLDREKNEHRARQTELRNWAKVNGSIRYGRKVMELVYSEHLKVIDKDGLFEAVDRAVRYGEPFERSKYVRMDGRTDFKARDMTDDELEEARNGSD